MPGVMLRNRLDPDVGLMPREIALPVGAVGYTGLAPTVGGVIANALYVDGVNGDDSRTKAQARSLSTPWQTIGRAAWGSTNRASPNASEAAAAGDTVVIAAGTYTYSGTINNRLFPVYDPVNAGTSGSPITFRANGNVRLAAPSTQSPIVGSTGNNYITWYADHTAGSAFLVTCYAPLTGSAASDEVRVVPDTGPVVLSGLATGCRFEGFVMDGGVAPEWDDNYHAFRMDGAVGCTFRNNSISNFTSPGDDHSVAFGLYGSRDNVMEHNYITNCGGAVVFKDKALTTLQSGNIFRYNLAENFHSQGKAIVFSHVTTDTTGGGGGEDRSFIYQNIFNGGSGAHGLRIIGSVNEGVLNDWIYNNVFYDFDQAGLSVAPGTNTVGVRVWNNIVMNIIGAGARAVSPCNSDCLLPSASVIHLNRNVYFNYTGFYQGSDGNRTFASYVAAYTDQDQDSVDGDPVFVNAAAGDFHLDTGSPAIDLGRHPDTNATINAGPYITGSEEIGLET